MAFTIIGVDFAYTLSSLLVLAEKGVTDFKLVTPDFQAGEHKAKPHTDKCPFGTVPVLEDNGFILYGIAGFRAVTFTCLRLTLEAESRAIARYLADKYRSVGPALIPEHGDSKAWALFEQFASAEQANFDHFVQVLIAQKHYNPMRRLPTEPVIVEYFETKFREKLDIYDVILGKQLYMGGNEFSLIDIFYMPQIGTLFKMGEGAFVTDRPNIKAWWERVTARDSWKQYATQATGAK
ncbi:hypothetical protein BP5796_12823 [Coleophoma crateriformis]|uniref:glutathione transferase n=1 Tax=Coleophoma crateriformis TaxID=565419 RepID=A0A3D8Q6C1_9HELO|nr:hypothetical protein BP5796_12823 [Coleophoma crateriformis]